MYLDVFVISSHLLACHPNVHQISGESNESIGVLQTADFGGHRDHT